MTNVVHLPTSIEYETVTILREDYYGRPYVIPLGGGVAKTFTRATTVAGTLEDTYNLEKWKMRMVAIGMSLRPDYAAKINALGFQPADDLAAKQWKKKMDDLTEKCMNVAKADAPGAIGDALHAWTDRRDRGERLVDVPKEYLPHLRAYEAGTAALTHVHIERFSVHDPSETGGTPDRISELEGYDKLIIVDTKSGKDLEYGAGKICMQLAIYSRSVLYKQLVDVKPRVHYGPEAYERKPIGEVDQERGLVVALSAQTGKCELIWVDLVRGWQAVERGLWVRQWRKAKGLFTPFRRDLVDEIHARLSELISEAQSREELRAIHSNAGKAWTDTHAQQANQRWRNLPALGDLSTTVST